ncbi:hypothetical protein Dimus_000982, partial [Dionaea muscipula]
GATALRTLLSGIAREPRSPDPALRTLLSGPPLSGLAREPRSPDHCSSAMLGSPALRTLLSDLARETRSPNPALRTLLGNPALRTLLSGPCPPNLAREPCSPDPALRTLPSYLAREPRYPDPPLRTCHPDRPPDLPSGLILRSVLLSSPPLDFLADFLLFPLVNLLGCSTQKTLPAPSLDVSFSHSCISRFSSQAGATGHFRHLLT